MSVLTFTDVTATIGARTLFAGASATLQAGEKVALVGPNGSGKTTLLRMLACELPIEVGQVSTGKGSLVRYLPQRPEPPEGRSLREWVLDAFSELRRLLARLDGLHHEMGEATGDRADAVFAEAAELEALVEMRGGYDYERRADNIIAGLGFREDQLDTPALALSGGERARGALARLLCEEPDVLLLDEPTNHLDLSMLGFLEGWLRESKHTVLVVSHDRFFLDKVVTRVVSLEDRKLVAYRGNYTQYHRQREENEERAEKERVALEEHIAKEKAYIRRYKAGQRAREAAGREKRLQRLIEETMEQRQRPDAGPRFSFRFDSTSRAGEVVVETRDLAHAFDGRELFRGLDLDLLRGDRLGIIGPNGAGKTTLLGLITSELEPADGRLKLGSGVQLGYFRQHTEDLHADRSPVDEVHDAAPREDLVVIRSLLGRFGFSEDEQLKPIGALSGGERARVALCRVLIQRPNVLLLDEPTNHLDLDAREALEAALLEYTGTVVAVTHDRYFLDRLATKVLALGLEERPRLHLGNFSSYWEARAARAKAATQNARALAPAPSAAPRGKSPGRTSAQAKAAPAKPKPKKRRVRKVHTLDELERKIMAGEKEAERLSASLCDPRNARDHERLRDLAHSLERVKTELSALNEEWELWAE